MDHRLFLGNARLAAVLSASVRLRSVSRPSGLVPVDGFSPARGHFHTMLEVARLSKALKGSNAPTGDIGQRMRVSWKQTCLVDERALAYVNSKVRL